MNIKTELFSQDDLPDHLHHEVNEYVEKIFVAVAPLMTDENSLNFMMSALGWVSFLCIKEFVGAHHHEKAVLNQARSILKNLEIFKDREFLKEAKKNWESARKNQQDENLNGNV